MSIPRAAVRAASSRSTARKAPAPPTSAAARAEAARAFWFPLPLDLLPPQTQDLLAELLARRARAWQIKGQPRFFRYNGDSEPLLEDRQQRRFPGWTLREMRIATLRKLLGMELERALRLLTLPWESDKEQRATQQQALTGTLRHIGQIYREFRRRYRGDAGAERALRDEMLRLPA